MHTQAHLPGELRASKAALPSLSSIHNVDCAFVGRAPGKKIFTRRFWPDTGFGNCTQSKDHCVDRMAGELLSRSAPPPPMLAVQFCLSLVDTTGVFLPVSAILLVWLIYRVEYQLLNWLFLSLVPPPFPVLLLLTTLALHKRKKKRAGRVPITARIKCNSLVEGLIGQFLQNRLLVLSF